MSEYERIEIEVIAFEDVDIINTSDPTGEWT